MASKVRLVISNSSVISGSELIKEGERLNKRAAYALGLAFLIFMAVVAAAAILSLK